MHRNRCAVFFLLLPLLLISSAPAQETAGLRRVRISMTSGGVDLFPLMVAHRYGFFRAENLDAELILMSPATTIQALVGGDLDFVSVFSSSVRAALTGLPVRLVMAIGTASHHALVVKPGIRSMADLKGTTLAVDGHKTIVGSGMRILLSKHGLTPDTDVKLLVLGGGGSQITMGALVAGRIDGCLLSLPYNKIAVQKGFREIAYLREVLPIPTGGLTTTTQKIQSDPELIVRTIKATLKRSRVLRSNKADFVKILEAQLGVKDPELATNIYNQALLSWSENGLPPQKTLLDTIEYAKDSQGIKRDVSVAEVADFRFAQKAFKDLKEAN